MARLITREDFEKTLLAIPGVKSIALVQDGPGQTRVIVCYKFWTLLLWWRRRRASRAVHDAIYGGKPYNMECKVE